MGTTASTIATAGLQDRRRTVDARLARIGDPPSQLRTPPPEGQLGADAYAIPLVRDALVELGPLFAGFGRYLASRADVVARRDAVELSAIPDVGQTMTPRAVEELVARQLGQPLHHRFFSFDPAARLVTLWTERHDAWLAPGVPVTVTLVRADADALLADGPLLTLLQPWFGIEADVFAAAAEDYLTTLARRLDQTLQLAACATLAADASAYGSGFSAPVCYRDHCARGILTVERHAGTALGDLLAGHSGGSSPQRATLARRIASAWLRQALIGHVVPFDFTEWDIMVDGDRLVLVDAAFETNSASERGGFRAYASAVAEDDPDAASDWLLMGATPDRVERHEEDIRRRLRQAVPFRDGEWSGDDRFAEHAFVQWRMARQAGWMLAPHQAHLYRGLHSLSSIVTVAVPAEDIVLTALSDARLQALLNDARQVLNPFELGMSVNRRLQELLGIPRALDSVLTRAAEGRLRIRLNVSENAAVNEVRNRTVLLVAIVIGLTGLASIARYIAPVLGAGAERLAAVAVLVLGAWLLIAAARM